jgi:hypothetical protein
VDSLAVAKLPLLDGTEEVGFSLRAVATLEDLFEEGVAMNVSVRRTASVTAESRLAIHRAEVARWSEQHELWQQRVERWATSGLTAGQFAAVDGVNQHTLTWWKCRLGKRLAADPSVPMSFVALRQASPAAPVTEEPFEIVLASGHRIRVPMSFDAAALSRLVEALEGVGR